MTLNRPLFVAALVAAHVLLWLGSCHTTPPAYVPMTPDANKITTAEVIRSVKASTATIPPKLAAVKTGVDSLTPENVVTVKPVLQQQVGFVIADFSDLTVRVGKLETSNAADVAHTQAVEKENTERRDAERNAQKATLNAWGFGFLIPSIIILMIIVTLCFIPTIGPIVKRFATGPIIGCAAGIAVGLAFLTLATFIVPLEIAIAIASVAAFITGAVCLIVWLWRKYKTAHGAAAVAASIAASAVATAKDVVESIEKGKRAGQIIFTDAAKDKDKSVVTAYQSDTTAKFVNQVQAAMPPTPNLASPANEPQNVAAKPAAPSAP